MPSWKGLLAAVPLATQLLTTAADGAGHHSSIRGRPPARPVEMKFVGDFNNTNGSLGVTSSCSQYSGTDDNMCNLCASQTGWTGDCFWCSADNSCHDHGSLDYPASCNVDGCVSHSSLTDCTGSCAAGHVTGFDVPLAQCMLGIANATYYTGKTLPIAFDAIGISQYKTMTDAKLDTQGVVIAHPDANAITVSFRGTELVAANEKLDIDCTFDKYQTTITDNQASLTGSWEVANGFSQAYLSLRSQMYSNINWALGLVGSKPKMYITGHSLGAAMATIMGSEYALGNLTSVMGDVEVITFAAPRSGNPDYATGVDKLMPTWWSVQNFFDQIPHLPTQSMGFRHVNNIVIIGPNEGNIVQVSTTNDDEHFNITANPISFHYTKSYMAQLNGLDGAASGPTSCPTSVLE